MNKKTKIMTSRELSTIELPNGLKYRLSIYGSVIMINAKTINRYYELKTNQENGLQNYLEQVAKECDPQEVYFSEFNDFECCCSCDDSAIEEIIRIYGADVARKIHRLGVAHSIDWLLTPDWVKFERMMLSRLCMDCDYYLGCGNRYTKNLWAQDEKAQIAEMRKRLANLPEEYRPEGMSEKIDWYEQRMC